MSNSTRVPPWSTLGWAAAVLATGPVVAYLSIRHDTARVLALYLLAALPLALTRPDLLALGLVPLSVAVGLFAQGYLVLLAAVAVAAVGVVVVPAVAGPAARHRYRYRLGWPVLGTAGLAVLLLVSATVPGGAASHGLPPGLAGLLVGLVMLAAVAVAPPDPLALARIVVLTGAAAAGYTLLLGDTPGDRLAGLGLNTNYLGALLAGPLAAGVALARRRPGPGSPVRAHWLARVGWLAAAAVCLTAIVATHSRGALLAATAGVAVAVLGDRPVRQQIAGALGAAALAGIAALGAASTLRELTVGSRGTEEMAFGGEIRAAAARLALDLALRHPIRGVGYGMFPELAAHDLRLGVYINTHNDYLRLAAEAGAPALLAFLALLIAGLTVRAGGALAPGRTGGAPTLSAAGGALTLSAAGGWLTPVRAVVAAGAVNLVFANTLANLIVSGAFWVCLGCLLARRSRWTVARNTPTLTLEGDAPWLTARPSMAVHPTVRPKSTPASGSPLAPTGSPSSNSSTATGSTPRSDR